MANLNGRKIGQKPFIFFCESTKLLVGVVRSCQSRSSEYRYVRNRRSAVEAHFMAHDFADKHVVTQVEKWMAIIREISRERLSSDLITSAEIDERTTVLLALTDKIIEANRTKREST
jgi:hypothetical protein